mgnify:FL=1
MNIQLFQYLKIDLPQSISNSYIVSINTFSFVHSCYFASQSKDSIIIHYDTKKNDAKNQILAYISQLLKTDIGLMKVSHLNDTIRYIIKNCFSKNRDDLKKYIKTKLWKIDPQNIYVKYNGFNKKMNLSRYNVFFTGYHIDSNDLSKLHSLMISNENINLKKSTFNFADNSNYQLMFILKNISHKVNEQYVLNKLKSNGIEIKSYFRPKDSKTMRPLQYMIISIKKLENINTLEQICLKENFFIEKYNPTVKKFNKSIESRIKSIEKSIESFKSNNKNVKRNRKDSSSDLSDSTRSSKKIISNRNGRKLRRKKKDSKGIGMLSFTSNSNNNNKDDVIEIEDGEDFNINLNNNNDDEQ